MKITGIVLFVVIVLIVTLSSLIKSHPSQATRNALAAKYNLLSSQAIANGNKKLALVYAKKVLAENPNNIDNILRVAALTKQVAPSTAKQYYLEAFNEFIQQNNLSRPNRSPGVYFAAAKLALQAGETTQAKIYYKDVLKVANPSNSFQSELVEQSELALADMKK